MNGLTIDQQQTTAWRNRKGLLPDDLTNLVDRFSFSERRGFGRVPDWDEGDQIHFFGHLKNLLYFSLGLHGTCHPDRAQTHLVQCQKQVCNRGSYGLNSGISNCTPLMNLSRSWIIPLASC